MVCVASLQLFFSSPLDELIRCIDMALTGCQMDWIQLHPSNIVCPSFFDGVVKTGGKSTLNVTSFSFSSSFVQLLCLSIVKALICMLCEEVLSANII